MKINKAKGEPYLAAPLLLCHRAGKC